MVMELAALLVSSPPLRVLSFCWCQDFHFPLTCRSNWTCLCMACPVLQPASKGLPLSLVLQTATVFHYSLKWCHVLFIFPFESKQAKLAVQNQLWLFSILFPEQGRKLTDLALSLSSLPVFTQKFLSSIKFFLLAFPSCSVEQSVLAKRVNISNNHLCITREQQMSPDP